MTSPLRAGLATVVGALIAVVLAYLAAIVVMLATIGIPLGAESRPLSAVQAVLLLVCVATAAFAGGRIAGRIARARLVTLAVPTLLAVLMLWGFSGRHAWPAWWGPAAAIAMALGAWRGGIRAQSR